MNNTASVRIAVTAVATVGLLSTLWWLASGPPPASPPPAAASAPLANHGVDALLGDWRDVLAAHRKIIVLLADEKKLSPADKAAANAVGHGIFHDNRDRVQRIERSMPDGAQPLNPPRIEQWSAVLDFVESGQGLMDADRLAFKELLVALQTALSQDGSLPAIKMHKRVGEDLGALAEIERLYEKEMRQIFQRFDTRSIELKRERWSDYVTHLRTLYSRDQIMKDYGVIVPFPDQGPHGKESANGEIFGNSLPARTVLLTFDDGPHAVYSDEIAAILKQYGVPAVFFEVGQNVGTLDASGKAVLGRTAQVSKRLKDAGYALGNHSFTHAQLSKKTGDSLKYEILNTDALLKAVDPGRSPLFRFPYGARNQEGLTLVGQAQLRSVMWNIDSLDWADPVPSSIADRVLQAVEQENRGIILFHDIHERTVKALPMVLDKLVAQGYQFAGWDGTSFTTVKSSTSKSAAADRAASQPMGYENSWALVIGIDDYAKWPHLQYASRDASAMAQLLIDKFGFAKERVITLRDAQATRSAILDALNEGFVKAGVKKNDRLVVFFAGHGATRKLSSGRDLGYLVPVDSNPAQIASDGIAMTDIQNIVENLTAKHVLFIMDACYSGLGLTRGASSANFLRDNAQRVGRQMLTAGGADQLVADGGPNGHSVFTWALLQGLGGKADLNGDGIITATELAAYVAPAVAGVSQQTPAFGSLPGSEGGDFMFELPSETEFLSAQTGQLPGEVIALNARLDTARPHVASPSSPTPSATAPTTVSIKDLQGNDQKLTTPVAVTSSSRQLAQRANDRGLQHYREKRYAEAEAEFTLALKHRGDYALAANNLGFVYFKQDKFAEAARWFENTLKMDPSRAVAYLNLGDAYARLGDSAKARKAFETYLALGPSASSAANVMAQLDKLPKP